MSLFVCPSLKKTTYSDWQWEARVKNDQQFWWISIFKITVCFSLVPSLQIKCMLKKRFYTEKTHGWKLKIVFILQICLLLTCPSCSWLFLSKCAEQKRWFELTEKKITVQTNISMQYSLLILLCVTDAGHIKMSTVKQVSLHIFLSVHILTAKCENIKIFRLDWRNLTSHSKRV